MSGILSSRDNQLIKDYLKLKVNRSFRRKTGTLALEGPNLVGEALKAGLQPLSCFFSETYFQAEGQSWLPLLPEQTKVYLLTDALFKAIADTETPRAIAAVIPYPYPDSETNADSLQEPLIILDQLQDPGNMGTIIRTAAAGGIANLFYTAGSVDPYSPKVLRATAGAIFRLQVSPIVDPPAFLDTLQSAGFKLIVATSANGADYRSAAYQNPLALVIGNEAHGVSGFWRQAANQMITIPLNRGVESLNAAVAAGLLIFEIMRHRRPPALEE